MHEQVGDRLLVVFFAGSFVVKNTNIKLQCNVVALNYDFASR